MYVTNSLSQNGSFVYLSFSLLLFSLQKYNREQCIKVAGPSYVGTRENDINS